jgi:hypothetical protein
MSSRSLDKKTITDRIALQVVDDLRRAAVTDQLPRGRQRGAFEVKTSVCHISRRLQSKKVPRRVPVASASTRYR